METGGSKMQDRLARVVWINAKRAWEVFDKRTDGIFSDLSADAISVAEVQMLENERANYLERVIHWDDNFGGDSDLESLSEDLTYETKPKRRLLPHGFWLDFVFASREFPWERSEMSERINDYVEVRRLRRVAQSVGLSADMQTITSLSFLLRHDFYGPNYSLNDLFGAPTPGNIGVNKVLEFRKLFDSKTPLEDIYNRYISTQSGPSQREPSLETFVSTISNQATRFTQTVLGFEEEYYYIDDEPKPLYWDELEDRGLLNVLIERMSKVRRCLASRIGYDGVTSEQLRHFDIWYRIFVEGGDEDAVARVKAQLAKEYNLKPIQINYIFRNGERALMVRRGHIQQLLETITPRSSEPQQ